MKRCSALARRASIYSADPSLATRIFDDCERHVAAEKPSADGACSLGMIRGSGAPHPHDAADLAHPSDAGDEDDVIDSSRKHRSRWTGPILGGNAQLVVCSAQHGFALLLTEAAAFTTMETKDSTIHDVLLEVACEKFIGRKKT